MAGSTVRSKGRSANAAKPPPRKPGPVSTAGDLATGEFALLARIRRAVARAGRGAGVEVGIGDDAAVVRPAPADPAAQRSRRERSVLPALVLTTDTMVEGVHFERDWLRPRELGVRAYRAAVSDIAAMGARPLWVLLSLELPVRGQRQVEAVEHEALELVRAVSAEARRTGAALVGGNISGGHRSAITVTVIGQACGNALLRSGAKPGHLVFVTGALGGSAAGCRELLSKRAAGAASGAAGRAATAAYRRPPLRIRFAMALARQRLAASMIDVSDGLVQDLGHLATESGVAIRIDPAAVPVARSARATAARGKSRKTSSADPALELALAGGEDYELAFTSPPSRRNAIEKIAKRTRTPVTVIGVVERGQPAVTDTAGAPFALSRAGFDHLRPRRRKR